MTDLPAEVGRSGRKEAEIRSLCSRVIAEQGYEKASIRKIADALGMSISALYYYYASKEDLLFAIQHDAFRELVEALEKKLAGADDPEQKLRILVGNHLDYFLPRLNELVICSCEIDTLKGKAYDRVWEIRHRYYTIALGIVREIQAGRGGLKASLATLNLFGMLNWIYMWFDPKRSGSRAALTQELCDLFLHGISPGGGR